MSAAEPRNDFKMKRRAEAVLGVSLDSEDCCERGVQETANHGDVIIAVLLQADLPHFNRRNDVYRLLLTWMDLMHMAESGSGKALTV